MPPILPAIRRSRSDSELSINHNHDLNSEEQVLQSNYNFGFDDDVFVPIESNLKITVPTHPVTSALQELHNAMAAPMVHGYGSGYGSGIYKPLDEKAIIGIIQKYKPLFESKQFDINAPIGDESMMEGRYFGYPPLAAAVRESNVALVKELLKLKTIDLGARDNRIIDPIPFRTVLMHAVRGAVHGNPKGTGSATEVLELLLKDYRICGSLNETSQSEKDGENYTALDIALYSFYQNTDNPTFRRVVDLLSECGAITFRYLLPL